MNRVHEDGRALITLSKKTKKLSKKDAGKSGVLASNKQKAVPSAHVQRQDTDYDVKPSIKKPQPTVTRKVSGRSRKTGKGKTSHQLRAETPDTGMPVHATQMGESEGEVNLEDFHYKTRIIRSLYG